MNNARFGICLQIKSDKLQVWNSGRCFHCCDYYTCQETLITYVKEREYKELKKEAYNEGDSM